MSIGHTTPTAQLLVWSLKEKQHVNSKSTNTLDSTGILVFLSLWSVSLISHVNLCELTELNLGDFRKCLLHRQHWICVRVGETRSAQEENHYKKHSSRVSNPHSQANKNNQSKHSDTYYNTMHGKLQHDWNIGSKLKWIVVCGEKKFPLDHAINMLVCQHYIQEIYMY